MNIATIYKRYICAKVLRWFRPKQYVYRKPKQVRIASTFYPDARLGFNEYWQYVRKESDRSHFAGNPGQTSHTQPYPIKPRRTRSKPGKTR